jgi:hypothetical protein
MDLFSHVINKIPIVKNIEDHKAYIPVKTNVKTGAGKMASPEPKTLKIIRKENMIEFFIEDETPKYIIIENLIPIEGVNNLDQLIEKIIENPKFIEQLIHKTLWINKIIIKKNPNNDYPALIIEKTDKNFYLYINEPGSLYYPIEFRKIENNPDMFEIHIHKLIINDECGILEYKEFEAKNLKELLMNFIKQPEKYFEKLTGEKKEFGSILIIDYSFPNIDF